MKSQEWVPKGIFCTSHSKGRLGFLIRRNSAQSINPFSLQILVSFLAIYFGKERYVRQLQEKPYGLVWKTGILFFSQDNMGSHPVVQIRTRH